MPTKKAIQEVTAATAEGAALEAMAKGLNARGMPYRLFDQEFPPGEWVPVTAGQAGQLAWMEWAEIRPQEAP